MFHIVAYNNSALGTTANTDISAVQDDIITIQNNHFLLPMDLKVMAAFAASPTLIRARMTSPKLRQITQPQIRPINVGQLPANNPNVMWLTPNYLVARKGEELAVQATANPGTTESAFILLWLADKLNPVPPGDYITLRATSTGTATTGAWTTISYTLDDQLPAGVYSLVGSECISTNGLAHRWIMDNYFFRPGLLSTASSGNRTFDAEYMAKFGELGRFINTSLPRLQVLANGADASHTIYMNVIQVSGFAGQSA